MKMSDPIEHWRQRGTAFVRAMVDLPLRRLLGRQHEARHQPGAGPGVLFIPADAAATAVTLSRIAESGTSTLLDPSIDEIRAALAQGDRVWLDVAGFADDGLLRELAALLDLHSVILADLVNVDRQTKVDSLAGQHLIMTQVLQEGAGGQPAGLVQLGLVLLGNVVVSFRERPGPLFEPIYQRLNRPGSRLRAEPLDYLAHALLDVAVDASLPVVESLADFVDELEGRIMDGHGHSLMVEIHGQRRALITLGRLVWRQRDLMARLLRDDLVFRRETQVYLRDVYDRTVQLLDMIETTRELAASLVEIHLSMSANRSNQIMSTLTIMASIFIPLTFIAGVYGMNFERMPELTWTLGYPLVLLLMLAVALGLLAWFRRRGWLGRGD